MDDVPPAAPAAGESPQQANRRRDILPWFTAVALFLPGLVGMVWPASIPGRYRVPVPIEPYDVPESDWWLLLAVFAVLATLAVLRHDVRWKGGAAVALGMVIGAILQGSGNVHLILGDLPVAFVLLAAWGAWLALGAWGRGRFGPFRSTVQVASLSLFAFCLGWAGWYRFATLG